MEGEADRISEAIAELEEQARERQRTAAAGEVLYESAIPGGGLLRRHKRATMVKSGGVDLPDRVRYYRSANGMEAWLPTAQLPRMLAKRHEDGTPVFVREQPTFVQEHAYEATCEVCRLNRPGVKLRSVWPNEFAYYGHMNIFHPDEWQMIQKRTEKKEGLLSAIANMNDTERAALKALLGGDDGDHRGIAITGAGSGNRKLREDGQGTVASCDCGWQSKPVKQPAASLATHKRFHCTLAGGRAN